MALLLGSEAEVTAHELIISKLQLWSVCRLTRVGEVAVGFTWHNQSTSTSLRTQYYVISNYCNLSQWVNLPSLLKILLPCLPSSPTFAGSNSKFIAASTFAIIVIILSIYYISKEFVSLIIYDYKDYITYLKGYDKLLLYLLSIIFVFVFLNDCGCPMKWQWQIGIFTLFLGWINLIFTGSNFPGTGLYVIMFKKLFWTFFSLVLFAFLLVAAFSLILFMMFHNPTAKVSIDAMPAPVYYQGPCKTEPWTR